MQGIQTVYKYNSAYIRAQHFNIYVKHQLPVLLNETSLDSTWLQEPIWATEVKNLNTQPGIKSWFLSLESSYQLTSLRKGTKRNDIVLF
jgi:hypothetical protein